MFRKTPRHYLITLHGIVIHSVRIIILRQLLLEIIVVRFKFHGFLYIFSTIVQRILTACGFKHQPHCRKGFGGFGVYFQSVAQKVERCRIIAFLLLYYRFKKKFVKAALTFIIHHGFFDCRQFLCCAFLLRENRRHPNCRNHYREQNPKEL